ncbi:hypothetical protein [Dendrosporobacter sp. 1207_IL3150]|uniref:hypothetical protein n=1 Tax=Dendrosporobacter sp. 1207_IL3150 TaxID=3084054 RepID=UPI002FD969BA
MNFTKKSIAALIIGVFILGGAVAPFIIKAVTANRSSIDYRQIDPAKAAEQLSDRLNIDKDIILKHHSLGLSFKDITKAAYIAAAADQSIDYVINQKNSNNTWQDVAASMNISKEQIKTVKQTMIANRLQTTLGFDKQTTLPLIQQGYHSRHVAMAGLLANDSGKSINDIVIMKTKNNNWTDVGAKLGIDTSIIEKHKQELNEIFPMHKSRYAKDKTK